MLNLRREVKGILINKADATIKGNFMKHREIRFKQILSLAIILIKFLKV